MNRQVSLIDARIQTKLRNRLVVKGSNKKNTSD